MNEVKLYDDIFELPFSIFIDIVCNEDYQLLVINGKADHEQQLDTWQKIYSQYLDLLEDSETIYILEQTSDLSLLAQKINEIEFSLYFLSANYDSRLVNIIRKNGISVNLNAEDQQNYLTEIKRIKGRLAPLKFQLQELSSEVASYHRSNRDTYVAERKSFYLILQKLARYQKVAVINPKEISTGQYVIMLKDYIQFQSRSKTVNYGEEDQGY